MDPERIVKKVIEKGKRMVKKEDRASAVVHKRNVYERTPKWKIRGEACVPQWMSES